MAAVWLGRRGEDAAELDAARLTRHGVVFGATGSGKTGMCVCLLEELALAGIPVLAIDPKGDLGNLALGFSGPDAQELVPFVDPTLAEREGQSSAEWAAQEATRWAKGRASSGVTQARIDRYVNQVEVVVHTPGSSAGVPVDVLSGLDAAPEALGPDAESRSDLAGGAISALLDLVGVRADRLRDPRHIVLTRLLETAWEAGERFDLERLIVQLVEPPFDKVGVFPLEQFLPHERRMELAMRLNGLVASSGFAAWRTGTPLDFDALLSPTAEGKTPVRVFSLAHLDDAQRQFFGAMFLHRLVAWIRRQPGSGGLRALLYIDEVFGYCPPHPAQPATKRPILQLIKQARAMGLGVVLTSQNPVDVDHAVISNAGTWFLGRLATSQDRNRMLEGVSEEERRALDTALDGLGKWQFAVRPDGKAPWVLSTRHAISWLRGPLTLREIERLGQNPEPVPTAPARVPEAPVLDARWQPDPMPAPRGYTVRWLNEIHAHTPRFAEVLGDRIQPALGEGRIGYEPALYARLNLRFDQGDFVVDRQEDRLFYPIDRGGGFAGVPRFEEGDLREGPPEGATCLYASLPEQVDEARELKALERRVIDEVLAGETAEMYVLKALKLESRGGEALGDFRARARAVLEDRGDAEIAKLKERVDRKLDALEAKHDQISGDIARYEGEAKAKLGTELVHAGEMVFGLFFGGRKKSLGTVMNKREQTQRANRRVDRAEERLTRLDREIYELEVETEEKIEAIRTRWNGRLDEIETKPVRLEKNDLRLDDFGIVWIPVSRPI